VVDNRYFVLKSELENLKTNYLLLVDPETIAPNQPGLDHACSSSDIVEQICGR